MKQLAFVTTVIAAMLFAGVLVWKAEATPLSGSVDPLAVTKSSFAGAKRRLHVRHDPLPGRHQMDVRARHQRDGRDEEVQVQTLLGQAHAFSD